MIANRIELEYGFSVRVNKENAGTYPVYGSNGPIGYIDNYKIKGPGVIVGRKGSVGKVTFTKGNFTPTDTTYYLKIKNEKEDSLLFWYYFLKLLKLDRLNTHSSVPGLSRDSVYGLNLRNIKIPEKGVQDSIANFLFFIDDKIELNNKINKKLDTISKMLYDYWFVQFDFPNKDGKPYKTSGGRMVWNEELKREIPDGWSVGTLLNIATFTNGLPCQKFRPDGNNTLKVIKIKEMHEGFSSDTEFVRSDIPKNVIIQNGDVLFSWSASLEVQMWSGGTGALNQHIFKVSSDKYPKSFYFYQLLNYLEHFKMIAANRKTTMGHITQEHLEQSRIVLPLKDSKNLLIKFENLINPLFEKKIKNEIENQILADFRDWLLPMLMNGQVKIN